VAINKSDLKIILIRTILLLLLISTATIDVLAESNQSKPVITSHDNAIQLARQGKHDQALLILKPLLDAQPNNKNLFYDYLTVLSWAERDREILELSKDLNPAKLPEFVLANIAKSALRTHNFALAVSHYQLLVSKFPEKNHYDLVYAWSLTEIGQAQKAYSYLKRRKPGLNNYLNELERLAKLMFNNTALLPALTVINYVLELSPKRSSARTQRIIIANELGAPHLAEHMSKQQAGLISKQQQHKITGDRLATRISWGELTAADKRQPFQETDLAIKQLQQRITTLSAQSTIDNTALLRSKYDLIEALHDRNHMKQVIRIYESLHDSQKAVPAYVRKSVADAYHQQRQLVQADEVYRQLILELPDDFNLQMAMFYLYIDLEDYDAALELISKLVTEQPAWVRVSGPNNWRENPDKLIADEAAAFAQAYSNRLHVAQQQFTRMLDIGPHNSDLINSLGTVYSYRGWPRLAMEQYRLALSVEPDHFDSQLAQYNALMDLGKKHDAYQQLQKLENDFPDNLQLERAKRQWQREQRYELRVEAARSFSSGVQEGGDDLLIETQFYGKPINYSYRPFIHSYYYNAAFLEGNANYHRFGVGLEYRKDTFEINTEINQNNSISDGSGLMLDINWMPDDFWRVNIGFDSNDIDVPLRGRLAEGLDGDSGNAGITYRFSESRQLSAGIQRQNFSDNNKRSSNALRFFQRLIKSPHYILDSSLAYYSSKNTRLNAPYYNPSSDQSIDLTLNNEWIISRRFENSFKHRLEVTVGQYDQDNFGSNQTMAAQYEQRWNLNHELELAYGISRFRRSYDGVIEYNTRYHLMLDWLF